MSPDLLHVKEKRVRGIKTLASVLLIAIGFWVASSYFRSANIPDLERYKYGDPTKWLKGFEAQPPGPLPAEALFVVGYSLLLSGFAWIYRCWAASTFGRRMARYVTTAVFVMAAADLVKDYFLQQILHRDSKSDRFSAFSNAVSAAAVIKWCAALLAITGIVAVLCLFLRGVAAIYRRYLLPGFRWFRREVTATPRSEQRQRIKRRLQRAWQVKREDTAV
ncbi:MAG TPA: hypothetical protein VHV77_02915, partial [Pirellulales bacterium]|nr:hypothetical protein [Pirellulales bacterium]